MQLDAVTKSQYAERLGYKKSYMEFLQYNHPCYQRNKETDQYHPNYIVQLTKNYRTHRHILNVANKLFYDGRLEAIAKEG